MKTTLTLSLVLFTTGSLLASDFDIRDAKEFKKCVSADAKVEKLASGMKFTEGPVWVSEGAGYLVFSDIPENELKRWTRNEGLITYRKPSANANGNTVDARNNLITCEHSGRRVSIEQGSLLKTLVDKYEGKRFNSPNDAVVKSDGTVYFTDPDYGLGKGVREIEGNYVYRYNPQTKVVTALVKDFDKPNGLCFSPDEKKLYIADSGKPKHIRVFNVQPDGTLADGKVFCDIDKGVPDGIRCDSKGRVWSSAGDGVHIFSPSGALIGKILVPEPPANLCFGGRNGKTLFITARTSLYSIPVAVAGAEFK
ncbi:MAG: SMP-30/gluconolactonase/LRE family protein [Verrucomicrobia bacterium]|nr:SMP-30/gluconolactonase/LRE family protein [Verrucomicrobiota bacterium]